MRGGAVVALALAADDDALLNELRSRFPGAPLEPGDPDAAARAVAHVDDPRQPFPFPLAPVGTPFQRRVWDLLRDIPVGTTTTYAALAEHLGDRAASRAVATACGANPIAVAIPCHRVLRGDGGLAGYRWGVDRKRALLVAEGALLG